MKHIRFGAAAAAAIFCATLAMPAPAAAFGGGIGVSFPAGGSHSSSDSYRNSNYAAFGFDQILEELSVKERHGRLQIEFKVTNNSDNPYTIDHRDGQVYDIAILDKDGKSLWHDSDGKAYTMALTSSSVAAHDSVTYKVEIDRKDYRQIEEGAVFVSAWLKDTPYTLTTKIPTESARSTPVTLHGGVIFGHGGWDWDD